MNCFTVAIETGAAHDRTVAGGGRSSVEVEEHGAVNTILGNLKTAMAGTYHAVKFAEYAHRTLAEVQYRSNCRCKLRAILHRLVRAAAVSAAMNGAESQDC